MKTHAGRLQFNKSTLSFICLTFLIVFMTHVYVAVNSPLLAPDHPQEKVIEIQRGMNIDQIALFLKEEGIIKEVWLFKLLTRIKRGMVIKAGEYQLDRTTSLLRLLALLQEGRTLCHRVTVPEGCTIRQIAAILAEQGLADAKKFIETASDPNLTRQLGIQAETLEGYLFPDTYCFSKGLAAQSIVRAMVEQFRRILPPEWEKRSAELELDLHQVITLASLIEKETCREEEKPLVSATYHNRLRAGMRLQCDPTVIYALEDFDGNLTREHLLIDSPYNTYRRYGLPPGPIASPGQESIRAALYPAETGYRYFVSKNNGRHHFSCTLKEHNRAVEKYQRRR